VKTIVIRLSWFAGLMDATTGVVLVAAPGAALGLADVALPGGEAAAILMRWIGAFVGGVGLSYLWAVAPRSAGERARRLPGVWGATAMIRTGVALFCLMSVVTGALAPIWIVVGLTDAALAIVQSWGLRAGWLAP